ncbi:sulfotransferase 1A1-like [Acanthaster planci]|uniref:Sulfotransferase 1A1-like n=1 Tax=Acanthaster planci TaxID=133434 RepID=A0A8B7Z9U1_ACAPL|nr:sulfotransferase 1A1-like [Acanthaster planci]
MVVWAVFGKRFLCGGIDTNLSDKKSVISVGRGFSTANNPVGLQAAPIIDKYVVKLFGCLTVIRYLGNLSESTHDNEDASPMLVLESDSQQTLPIKVKEPRLPGASGYSARNSLTPSPILWRHQAMWKSFMDFVVQVPAGQPQNKVEGITLPPKATDAVKTLKHWDVREDDVWLVTYPKAGTTWAQEIMSCVMYDGNIEEVNKKHGAFRVLFPDMDIPEFIRKTKNLPACYEIAKEMPSPRVIKTHMPGQLLPPQIWERRPKIVYIMRNPKDLTVSYFYFLKLANPSPDLLNETFEEFLNKTLTGDVFYGPWWNHYLYFWRKRNDPNILVLKYEDMKQDLRGNVEKISKFLGKNLSAETLDTITEHCSFAKMKNNPMASLDSILRHDKSQGVFMRKGAIGNWKTHFTVAQNEAMDAHIEEKLHGTGLTFNYN